MSDRKSFARPHSMLRRGFSLVELVVIMATSTVVLSVVATYLMKLYAVDRAVKNDREWGLGIRQFAQQLRNDAHAADSVELLAVAPTDNVEPNREPCLRLAIRVNESDADDKSLASEVVSYSMAPGGIERQVRHLDEVTKTDLFRVPHTARLVWNVQRQDNRQWLVITMAPTADEMGPATAHQFLNIRTLLGKDTHLSMLPGDHPEQGGSL